MIADAVSALEQRGHRAAVAVNRGSARPALYGHPHGGELGSLGPGEPLTTGRCAD